jgi:hypothetical protein
MGTYLHFGWLAVWVLSPDWQCHILKCAKVNRRLGEAATPKSVWRGGVWAVPRLCINLYPGICLKTGEYHGKPQSGHQKSARLISAERDSFSLLGQRLAMASTGLPAPPLLAMGSGDGVNLGQRKYLPSCRTKGFPHIS